jgi:hypothetical protein
MGDHCLLHRGGFCTVVGELIDGRFSLGNQSFRLFQKLGLLGPLAASAVEVGGKNLHAHHLLVFGAKPRTPRGGSAKCLRNLKKSS